MTEQGRKCIAAVRVRGTISASRLARETLKMLNLKRNNHAVLIDNSPSFVGMLKIVENLITWGEPSKETVTILISRKGRVMGNKRLTEEYAQKAGYESLEDLEQAVFECRASYWRLPNIQPAFRLHPPTKGFKGKTKKGYGQGGELGYRGAEIDELLKRMA